MILKFLSNLFSVLIFSPFGSDLWLLGLGQLDNRRLSFSSLLPTGLYALSKVDCLALVVESLSRVQLFATPWTVAYQAPWSMVFFRQEYWTGLPFPSPGDFLDPGIEPESPTL